MVSILFESEILFKEVMFSLNLFYQTELKILQRKHQELNIDVKFIKPDVLIIDLPKNPVGFLEKVKSIRNANKNVKIILMVDSLSDHIRWLSNKLGVNEILLKNVNPNEFVQRVLLTISGNNIGKSIDIINLEEIILTLTITEKTIFEFIGKGLTTQEISALLNISKRTVDTHRTKILKKLNCKNSSKLIYIATSYNLLKLI